MTKLVFGCGYLGRRVAERWRGAGEVVVAVTRSHEKARQLAGDGLRPLVADVTRPETLVGLPMAETVLFSVGYDRHSGDSRWDTYVKGLRNVLAALPPESGRIIFISSTGVYGESDGRWIDEETSCRPSREAGQAFLAAERLLIEHPLGRRAIVLRLAGLYGPGRLPRKADLLAGKPLAVPVGGHLNLIHVDDAAAVVLATETHARPPQTYLVSDGHPADRREFYAHLAELLSAPAPRFVEPTPEALTQHHAGANKRVSNARMLAELQVQLSYPTFQQGLSAIVTGER